MTASSNRWTLFRNHSLQSLDSGWNRWTAIQLSPGPCNCEHWWPTVTSATLIMRGLQLFAEIEFVKVKRLKMFHLCIVFVCVAVGSHKVHCWPWRCWILYSHQFCLSKYWLVKTLACFCWINTDRLFFSTVQPCLDGIQEQEHSLLLSISFHEGKISLNTVGHYRWVSRRVRGTFSELA